MSNLKQLIKEFRELREKATHGEWVCGARKIRVPCIYTSDNKIVPGQYPSKFIASFGPYNRHDTGGKKANDRDFTVYSANNITKLLDAMEVLVEAVEFYAFSGHREKYGQLLNMAPSAQNRGVLVPAQVSITAEARKALQQAEEKVSGVDVAKRASGCDG